MAVSKLSVNRNVARTLILILTSLSIQSQNLQSGAEGVEKDGEEQQGPTREETRSVLRGYKSVSGLIQIIRSNRLLTAGKLKKTLETMRAMTKLPNNWKSVRLGSALSLQKPRRRQILIWPMYDLCRWLERQATGGKQPKLTKCKVISATLKRSSESVM